MEDGPADGVFLPEDRQDRGGTNIAATQLAALLNSSTDLIWAVDREYRLTMFNRALAENFERNYGLRAAVGMGLHDLLPPERAAVWPPIHERALANGRCEVEYELLDGRTLNLTVNAIIQDGQCTGFSVFGKDVSQRKAAEEALRAAEANYRSLFESAPEGISRISPEGELLAANPAFAKIYGYDSPEEALAAITKTTLQLWLDPSERSRYIAMLAERDVVFGYECRMKRKDGTAIWVSLNTRRVSGPDGQTLYYEGSVEDITERKRRQTFTQSLIDTSPAFIVAIGTDGRVLTMNRALLEALEFSLEEVQGKDYLTSFVPEPDRAGLKTVFRQIVDGRRHTTTENRIVSKSGCERLVEWHGSPVIGADRQTDFYVGVGIDVTEHRAAEHALRTSEQRFRGIFDSSYALMGLLSPDGTLLEVNRTALEVIGARREDVVGQPFWDTPWWSHSASLQRRLQRMIAGAAAGEVQFGEADHLARDGRVLKIEFTLKPIFNEDGAVMLIVPEGRDVTKIHALTARLINAHEEERARLARELHDDLSQRVAIAGIAMSNLKNGIPKESEEALEQCDRVRQMLVQLGEGIRLLSHQLHPSVLRHSGLTAALRSYCAECSNLAALKVAFQADGPCDDIAPAVALCVYRATQEALQNVIKHAGVDEAEVALACDEGVLRLVVSDRGAGMSDKTPTGLGLISIAERARLVGGTVELQSQPGHGVTLTLTVPAHAGEQSKGTVA